MKRERLYSIATLLKERVFNVLGWQLKGEPVIKEAEDILLLMVETGKKVLKVGVEYRKALLRATPSSSLQDEMDIVMVAAPHIGHAQLERLKANNVNAIDETGNYYFSYRSGKDHMILYEFNHKSKAARLPRIGAFSPKAGYMVMCLLTAERFEISTMRELQAKTGVSLSGIFSICEAMKRNNLIDYSKSLPIRVLNPSRFLDEWAAYYKLRLAPKINRQGYLISVKRIVDKESGEVAVQHLDWREGASVLLDYMPKSALTGVQAAQSVSRFYALEIGEILVNNLHEAERELTRQFILTPTSRNPDMILIEPYNSSSFVGINEEGKFRTAHPIQIYLDLLTSDDPRANEFSEIYREQALGY